MVIRAFITHKQAEYFADCQDRFGVNPDTKSIAVSDGMSQSWQQKIWAQLLVKTFTDSTVWLPNRETIRTLCESWRNKIRANINQQKDKPRTNLTQKEINMLDALIYRNERNLAEGRSAGATFVGIRFNGKQWNGTVLGDSCLIEWDGQKANFHTSQNVDTFDSYPDYFDSNVLKEGKGTPKTISGILSDGKNLFIVSDPFSEFLLEHSKQGDIEKYIGKILNVYSHEDFESLVSEWRQEGMHNDDTTLVIVENDDLDIFSIRYMDEIQHLMESEITEKSKKKEQEKETLVIQDESKNNQMEQSINKKDTNHLIDVSEFIEIFLSGFRAILEKKCNGLQKLKFKKVKDAAQQALLEMFEKYTITHK